MQTKYTLGSQTAGERLVASVINSDLGVYSFGGVGVGVNKVTETEMSYFGWTEIECILFIQ